MSGRRTASLLLIGLLWACGGKKPDRAAVSTTQDSSTLQPETRSERPIGRSDAVMNGLRPALHEWVAMWRRAIPGFEVDSLRSEGRSAWSISWTPAFTPNRFTEVPWEDSLTAAVFTVQSPDGEFDLEIDDYQAITEDGGVFSVGGEPDS